MKKLKAKISMILNGAKFKKNHLHINYTSFGNCVILYSHCFQLSKYTGHSDYMPCTAAAVFQHITVEIKGDGAVDH